METWRLSRFPDLAGRGGRLTGARWHTAGRPVVYLARSAPGAILEVIVHLLEGDAPPFGYHLLWVDIPDAVSAEAVAAGQLPHNWRENTGLTQSIGDHWLEEQKTALQKFRAGVLSWVDDDRARVAPRPSPAAQSRTTFAIANGRTFGSG